MQNGDISPEYPHGVFHQDTRILSLWRLTINGQPLEPLSAWTPSPYQGIYIGRAVRADGRADSPLTVERTREVGAGILETITIRNYAPEPAACDVLLSVDADFADLFEVKDGRFRRHWKQERHLKDCAVHVVAVWEDVRKGVFVNAPGSDAKSEGLHFPVMIPAHGEWGVRVTVVPDVHEGSPPPVPHPDPDTVSLRDRRQQLWAELGAWMIRLLVHAESSRWFMPVG
ncbi:hypothetical protein J7E80_12840 [Arthrobacter sp. ISL-28]|nr:hypothetical protein [Arthrobacter sp. ISL-28]